MLQPDQPFIQSMLCTAYAHTQRLDDARAIAAHFSQSHDRADADGCLFDIAVGSGDFAGARKIMDKVAAQFPAGIFSACDLGAAYAVAGGFDKAVFWLERAYEGKNFVLFTIPYDKTIPPAFFETPHWKALRQRLLFKDWQVAHDKLAAELAKGG